MNPWDSFLFCTVQKVVSVSVRRSAWSYKILLYSVQNVSSGQGAGFPVALNEGR